MCFTGRSSKHKTCISPLPQPITPPLFQAHTLQVVEGCQPVCYGLMGALACGEGSDVGPLPAERCRQTPATSNPCLAVPSFTAGGGQLRCLGWMLSQTCTPTHLQFQITHYREPTKEPPEALLPMRPLPFLRILHFFAS